MGFYFDVVLFNTRTKEEKHIEVFRAHDYLGSWKNVVSEAIIEYKDTWSRDGDDKYWIIKSITDITKR